jgi:hypothetical protein
MPGSFSRSTYSEDRRPMPSPNVCILTEKLADQRFLGAIFLEEESLGLVEIIPCLTSSAAVSGAMTMLSNDPERPIAVVINADTEDPREVKAIRGSAWRLLAQQAPLDRDAIGRAHPGFAALAAFIKRLAPVPEPAT